MTNPKDTQDEITDLQEFLKNMKPAKPGKVSVGARRQAQMNPSPVKPTRPRFVGNGTDLIVNDDGLGTGNDKYIRFQNANISDMNIARVKDGFTEVTLKLIVYGGFDTKVVDIPSHIPTDQHGRYVQGVFDAKR